MDNSSEVKHKIDNKNGNKKMKITAIYASWGSTSQRCAKAPRPTLLSSSLSVPKRYSSIEPKTAAIMLGGIRVGKRNIEKKIARPGILNDRMTASTNPSVRLAKTRTPAKTKGFSTAEKNRL